jgi:putative membrane protein insertion efficiency factor
MSLYAHILRLPQQCLIGIVLGYRWLLKPWLGNACRFEPSCSAYALEALQGHGALRGSALGAWRLLRCHPWCDGGLDPVPPPGHTGTFLILSTRSTASTSPEQADGLFTRLFEPAHDPARSPRDLP